MGERARARSIVGLPQPKRVTFPGLHAFLRCLPLVVPPSVVVRDGRWRSHVPSTTAGSASVGVQTDAAPAPVSEYVSSALASEFMAFTHVLEHVASAPATALLEPPVPVVYSVQDPQVQVVQQTIETPAPVIEYEEPAPDFNYTTPVPVIENVSAAAGGNTRPHEIVKRQGHRNEVTILTEVRSTSSRVFLLRVGDRLWRAAWHPPTVFLDARALTCQLSWCAARD